MAKYSKEDIMFHRGYIIALCNVMRCMIGCDADIREAWGAGGYVYQDMKIIGIDGSDLEIIKLYKKQIWKKKYTP